VGKTSKKGGVCFSLTPVRGKEKKKKRRHKYSLELIKTTLEGKGATLNLHSSSSPGARTTPRSPWLQSQPPSPALPPPVPGQGPTAGRCALASLGMAVLGTAETGRMEKSPWAATA